MGGNKHSQAWPRLRKTNIWAVVQVASGSAFWMHTFQIWRACQTRSHGFSIQQAVILAPPYHAQTCIDHSYQRSGIAIQSIQPDQDLAQRKPMCEGIPGNCLQRALEFAVIFPVACPRIGADPLMRESLEHSG